MRQIFIACILITPATIAAQRSPLVPNPDPYVLIPHYDYTNASGIKKVCVVSRDKNDGFKNDTLNAEFYNPQGQKVKTIRYENNKPVSETLYTYSHPGHAKQPEWEMVHYSQPSQVTRSFSTYDDLNNLIKIENITLKNGKDTLNHQPKLYAYKNGQVLSAKQVNNKVLSWVETYHYTHGRLDSMRILRTDIRPSHKQQMKREEKVETADGTETIGYHRSLIHTYKYDDRGNLLMNEAIDYWNNSRTVTYRITYTYDKVNRVISDSAINFTDTTKLHYNCTYYSYNSNGKLAGMKAVYKDSYRNVVFDYEDNNITRIKVETNSANNAHLKFWIPYNFYSAEGMVYNYDEQREYDAKGNITAKKQLLGGELVKEILFVAEY